MRNIVILMIVTFPFISYSQGVFTNNTNAALQKVIGDYPNKFSNIKGEKLSDETQTIDYQSKVQIPGSLSSVITKYSGSDKKEVYSWKCLVFESDDFDVMSKKYKDLYNQIRNTIIKIEGEKPFIVNGSYEIPTEEKRFTTSTFYLLPATGEMKKLKIELSLEFYVTEWKINLMVYDRNQEEDFQARVE